MYPILALAEAACGEVEFVELVEIAGFKVAVEGVHAYDIAAAKHRKEWAIFRAHTQVRGKAMELLSEKVQ